jgi:hypothetical protein
MSVACLACALAMAATAVLSRTVGAFSTCHVRLRHPRLRAFGRRVSGVSGAVIAEELLATQRVLAVLAGGCFLRDSGRRLSGPLGSETNSPLMDDGTLCLTRCPAPGPLCATTAHPPDGGQLKRTDARASRLASIIHGETSAPNDKKEMLSLGNAVVNRALAPGGKTIEQLLASDPNDTQVIKGVRAYA